jgi:nitroreductase
MSGNIALKQAYVNNTVRSCVLRTSHYIARDNRSSQGVPIMSDRNGAPSHHGDAEHLEKAYPNETLRLLIERSSCRSFYNRAIPEDVMELILEAGTRAPTGGNLQPFSIIRIEKPEAKNRLAHLCEDQMFIAEAPTNLLFCIDWYRLRRWAELELAPFAATSSFRHFWISFQDTIIAAQNICTAADALGLGSCYVGSVLECFREIREMFELPDGVFPVVLLSLGYPKHRPEPRRKLDIGVITHSEKYRRLSDDEILEAFHTKYPYRGVEATAERVREMERVSRAVHGEDFARRCRERIEKTGRVNVAQRYFGLHYIADLMAQRNEEFLKTMKDFGLDWFEPYEPIGEP